MGTLGILGCERRVRGATSLIIFLLLATTGFGRAETNVWIKGASGVWEETNSWSLGVLPDSSQSIRIDGSWLAARIF